MRLQLGLVAENNHLFLNQVKLCLFSLRKNGGALGGTPVTLITNNEPLRPREADFIQENFSPIEFRTAPRLGAIPHTSKLNVFYSIDPSSYDVLMFLDCDTVIRKSLDGMTAPLELEGAEFLCRRGGETDRDRFLDFDALVARFCGSGETDKVSYNGHEEWPMFNSGVFLGTSGAIRRIRRDAIDFTYRLFNEWQRIDVLDRLPRSVKDLIESHFPGENRTRQHVIADWPLEQGALALACIRSGVRVRYLDEIYNSWGGGCDFRILHCFKSVYDFDRRTMFDDSSNAWIDEYQDSDIAGKRFLAGITREYRNTFGQPGFRSDS